ncbi:hypothetical protein [Pectobacterium aroidearum]|uniref:hypothetical protein n=1 Tax=Pectobacterium aroidearum TaxID=1201031 RepID=UPI00301711B9
MSAMLSIINNGFNLSRSNQDWLGHGVYFFTDGISDPFKNAIEWSKNKNPCNDICIIKVKIKVDDSEVLDLRTTNGLTTYNFYRDSIIDNYYDVLTKRRDITIKKRKDTRLDDCTIMSILQQNLNYKVIVHNVYIKNHHQRKLALESSYPNSTILCINELSCIEIIDILNI